MQYEWRYFAQSTVLNFGKQSIDAYTNLVPYLYTRTYTVNACAWSRGALFPMIVYLRFSHKTPTLTRGSETCQQWYCCSIPSVIYYTEYYHIQTWCGWRRKLPFTWVPRSWPRYCCSCCKNMEKLFTKTKYKVRILCRETRQKKYQDYNHT